MAPGYRTVDAYGGSNLTPNQIQIWVAQALVPQAPIYNLAAALSISGEVNPVQFQKAFQTLLNSIDALRTVFEENDGIPTQRVIPELSYTLPYIDFSLRLDPRSATKSWMDDRCKVPFDLRKDLFDSALLKLSSREFVWYLNTHHIVTDAWSVQLIYQLMSRFYQSAASGKLPPVADLYCFQDYVSYQRQEQGSPRHEKVASYWRQKLNMGAEPLRFYGKPATKQGTRVSRKSYPLGFEKSHKLRQVIRQLDCSSHSEDSSLLNAFGAVLCAYLERIHGDQSCFIGIASHNRRRKRFKQTVGVFSEVLPARVPINEADTFTSLMRKVNLEILDTIRHGHFAVANPVHEPIYDVVLNYHKVSFNDFCGMPSVPEWIHTGHGFESLTVQIHDFGLSGQLVLDFDFHDDVFTSEQVDLAVEHFRTVLDAFLADPTQPIYKPNLLTAEEERRVLIEWNNTGKSGQPDRGVHRLFEQQAQRTPHATAVASGEERLSYADLNKRANQLASHLKKLGVGPETRVGMYVGRSMEMVIGFLGILKAGGAYVPIDPSGPVERSGFILEDANVSVLLTQGISPERVPKGKSKVICLDSDWHTIAQENEQNLPTEVHPHHLAYVIYTSGSSGRPRGVEITHRTLANFTFWAGAAYGLGRDDRVLQFSSIGFDAAVEEVFPCLTQGATLVLRTDAMIESAPKFLERCRDWRITVLDLPTHYWHELTTELYLRGLLLPETVRLVIIGGEAASPERLREWQKCAGGRCRLLNTYGPTETTVVTTVCDLTQAAESDAPLERVPIGHPIFNVRTYVLDKHLNPVPVGVAGELYVAGAGLARGYLNQPRLTAEKFIDHSFRSGFQERIYRTGDIVRYLPDGHLDFLGRADRQLKILGYRVDPGEIETLLTEYPGVGEAAVTTHETETSGPSLVAYVVPTRGGSPTPSELRAYLSRMVPDYMMPVHVGLLESFPLTASGKIDRKALPRPPVMSAGTDEAFIIARSPIEKGVADIWSQVIGVERIGIYDNFFELGGHSLMATQIISRLREGFGVDLPLRSLFETPTIAGLASQIQLVLQQAHGPVERPSLVRVSREQELPLSFAQTRMWLMHRLAPQSPAYNLPVALRLSGRLNKAALQHGLNEIVLRHESVRTIFPSVDGQPRQVIADWQPITLQYVDLREVAQDQRLDEARKRVKEEARRPFDLERDLLIRTLLLQVEENDHILLLTMHHIASDQWSLGISARELTHLYNAFCNDRPPQLGPVAVQYADFAVWQRRWLENGVLRRQLSYWKARLAALPALALPADRPRPAVQTFNGACVRRDLSKSLINDLRKLSVREGATLYMTLLTAFNILLFRYSGQTDIAIGSPIANRNWLGLEKIVGTFVNTLILRTDLSGDPTFRELLKRVREVTMDAYAHQEAPFEKLVEELQPERDMSLSPLVQVLFNFQNAPLGDVNLHDLSWSPFEFDLEASQFDLCLAVDPDILSKIVLIYNPDLFDASRMDRMMEHYIRLLEEIVTHPETEVSQIKILSISEERQLLETWNNTQSDISQDTCTHEIFQAQVARVPDHVAVICDGQKATYRELNDLANQLANYLRALGVEPGVPVGIYMERSTEMIVGLLGIMKSGGAYLPLDPDYPSKRIATMMEDSGTAFIVTQERLLKALPENRIRVVCMDRDWSVISSESQNNLPTGTVADDLAYVIYTSGSSGSPKGVEISHRALTNFLVSMTREPGFTGQDVMLSVTSLSFDIAALEIFLPLIVGGRVVLAGRELSVDGRLLKEKVDGSGATVMQATPLTWRLLLEAGWEGNGELKILCGGEALTKDLAVSLMQRSASVWNLYGPTETTVWSMACKVSPGRGPITIGRPVANTQIYILDGHLRPVPIGVAGEIYIGGAGLARGYRGKPELTAEKFIRNPFSSESSPRLFKTGDLGRYLPDGNVEFLGRADLQVKIRGYRIELGEIESVLAEHSTVKQCVVAARQDTAGDMRLVAYVVPNQASRLSVSELQSHLKEKLPNFMVPAAFVVLRSLPLTPNGKIDRQGLPTPDSLAVPEKPSALPRDLLELRLTKIWEEILGTHPIGISENFFDLGGHSLLAVRLIARIEKLTGKNFPAATIFRAPTIEQLACILREGDSSHPWSSLVPIQTGGWKRPFFWVHGDSSGAFLPRYLGTDQPLFALEHQSQNGKRALYTRVDTIAAHYLEEIRTVQPDGPYFLGGYSFGGMIAFEMAQQLRREGEEVSLLALLDSHGFGRRESASALVPLVESGSTNIASLREDIDRHLRNLASFSTREKLFYVLVRVKNLIKSHRYLGKIRRVVKRAVCEVYLARSCPIPASLRGFYISEIYRRARRNYVPQPYPGHVVYFKSKMNSSDPRFELGALVTGESDICGVPGDHLDLREEVYVRHWAETLKEYLDKAQSIEPSIRADSQFEILHQATLKEWTPFRENLALP